MKRFSLLLLTTALVMLGCDGGLAITGKFKPAPAPGAECHANLYYEDYDYGPKVIGETFHIFWVVPPFSESFKVVFNCVGYGPITRDIVVNRSEGTGVDVGIIELQQKK